MIAVVIYFFYFALILEIAWFPKIQGHNIGWFQYLINIRERYRVPLLVRDDYSGPLLLFSEWIWPTLTCGKRPSCSISRHLWPCLDLRCPIFTIKAKKKKAPSGQRVIEETAVIWEPIRHAHRKSVMMIFVTRRSQIFVYASIINT